MLAVEYALRSSASPPSLTHGTSPSSTACARGVLVALLLPLAMLSACDREPRGSGERAEPFCDHRYTVDDGRVPVCATIPLAAAQLQSLERQLREVTSLYPSFASACGVLFDSEALTPPTLHVLRYEELNDRSAFPREESIGNILGRYYVGRSRVFVTERALEERGSVHLPHELAHWIHDASGLTDAQDDERLARAFHRYYRQREQAAQTTTSRQDGSMKARVANDDLLLAFAPEEDMPARDRSLAERADGHGRSPLFDELCGR